MTTPKRCGTCSLFSRSAFPGLISFGKCPHRHGWGRSHSPVCEHYAPGPKSKALKYVMALNVCAALTGFFIGLYLDIRNGNLVTHLVFAFACIAIPSFVYFVSRQGMFSEDAKYIVMEIEDRPPEADRDGDVYFL